MFFAVIPLLYVLRAVEPVFMLALFVFQFLATWRIPPVCPSQWQSLLVSSAILFFSITDYRKAAYTMSFQWWLSGRFGALLLEGHGFDFHQLPRRDLGQVLHSQLHVALRCVNSDTVSMLQLRASLSSSGLEEVLQKYPE